MNNRNPNKENSYSNLAAWCEKYHKDSGIKIHPSSIPVELVLEDVMGYIAHLRSNMDMLMNGVDMALKQIEVLQGQMIQSSELHAQTTTLMNQSIETKKVKKNEASDGKGSA